MKTMKRKEITLKQLKKLKEEEKTGGMRVADIQVEGVIRIFDKDGNLKSQLKTTTIDIEEE